MTSSTGPLSRAYNDGMIIAAICDTRNCLSLAQQQICRRYRHTRSQRPPGRGAGARDREKSGKQQTNKKARAAKNADSWRWRSASPTRSASPSASTIESAAARSPSATAASISSTTWYGGWRGSARACNHKASSKSDRAIAGQQNDAMGFRWPCACQGKRGCWTREDRPVRRRPPHKPVIQYPCGLT